MKPVRLFEQFINEASKSEYNLAIRDLKQSIKDTENKMNDVKGKIGKEKDPNKSEILTLTLSKLALKRDMLELDVKLNISKRSSL